jgi:uracil-DNA glycosylase family 4
MTETQLPTYTPAELAQRILDCNICSETKGRTCRNECSRPTPFWPRNDPSPLMFIGRNPGINEDKEGRPFVGRGGQLFESWLNALGISRDQIWLTNLLKCYTSADRKPKQAEITTCWHEHLRHEIAFCRPHFIVSLGSEAFTATTGHDRLTHRHSIIYDRRPDLGAYVMGVIHPGSALRSGEYMQSMIEDAAALKPLLPLILSGELLQAGLPEGITAQ